MKSHARFSPSSSHKYLNCPASLKAEEQYENKISEAAKEGILFHEILSMVLYRYLDNLRDKTLEQLINITLTQFHKQDDKDFAYNIKKSIDYIEKTLPARCDNYKFIFKIEKKLNINVMENQFGTIDFYVTYINDSNFVKHIAVYDFKYGFFKVNYIENSQLILYTLGVVKNLTDEGFSLNDDCSINLHIVQPRIDNFGYYSTNYDNLLKFENDFKLKSYKCLEQDPEHNPSFEVCRFCKHKTNSKALFNIFKNIIDMYYKDKITDEDKRYILDNADLIKDFISSVDSEIFDRLSNGATFEGYKLVKSRGSRKFRADAEGKLVELLQDRAYKKSLITLTEAGKLLDKDIIESLVYYCDGSVVLAKESDKRESVDTSAW